MVILLGLGIALVCAGYLVGVGKWIYQGNFLMGIFSLLVFFPILIAITSPYPAYYFRAIPLVGVGMFLHRYGLRILMQIKLLWFTTLTVLVVQGYYAFCTHFLGFRVWQ
jgi:hypothetical protein